MRDTLIGKDTNTGGDVHVADGSRPLGVAIIGKSGTGKSSLLEHLMLADLAQGTPGMVIDPHGLLAERIVRLTPPEHAHRLMLLEAIRTKPFGLNLLAVRDPIDEDDDPVTWAADSVIATIKKLYGEDEEFLPRLERYLDLAVRTLIPAKGTLLDAPRLFEDTGFRDTACPGSTGTSSPRCGPAGRPMTGSGRESGSPTPRRWSTGSSGSSPADHPRHHRLSPDNRAV